jgi:molybdenum cofactor guanylyltransferase
MDLLVGLVAMGGKSARMGIDKSLLQYHVLPQRYHVYRQLSSLCDKVMLACNTGQLRSIEKGYDFIQDDLQYGDIGPMKAILSAFDRFPGHSVLLMGCDYPFIDSDDISRLIRCRTEEKPAFAYYNEAVDVYETLLCIYETGIEKLVRQHYQQKQYSLQTVLKVADAGRLLPVEPLRIKSIDTVRDYNIALAQINQLGR